MHIADTFANRLKGLRLERGWTLAQMESITGIAAQTLNRYELGQHVPKIDVIPKLSVSLNVDPMWLQGYDVEKKPIIKNDNELKEIAGNKRKRQLSELVMTLNERQLGQLEKLLDAVELLPPDDK